MEKLKLHSKNITSDNIDKIADLFPNCITETQDANGEVKQAIDFDLLKQELSTTIVEGQKERYQLNWPGKRKALLNANAPIAKTLRPCRQESVDFDSTENLFIEGDNLDALKLLQETYLGKVKMIYIDPPYNTGNDFIYNDDFAESADDYLLKSEQKDEEGNRLITNSDSNGRFHSDWLSMMYSRLKLARNLLKEDGVIYISIDDNELHNLKEVCDEIFGAENFCANIIWQGGRKNDSKRFSIVHDYILVYVRNEYFLKENQVKWREKKLGLDIVYKKVEELKSIYGNDFKSATKALREWYVSLPEGSLAKEHSHYKSLDSNGVYYGDNISSPNYRKNLIFDYKGYKPPNNGWRYNQEAMNRLDAEGLLLFPESKDNRIQYKRYLHHTETWAPSTHLYKDRRAASKSLTKLMGGNYFDFPKDVNVLSRLIKTFTEKDDLIFDFFAGSSATAHAVMDSNAEDNGNRKFIMVQLPEECNEKSEAFKAGYKTIAEISKDRIRRAGNKIKEDNTEKEGIDKLDTGFRVLKIDNSNMQDVYYKPDEITQASLFDTQDNIKSDRTEEDLLFQVLLDWGVDLSLKIVRKEIEGQNVYFVDGNALAACFVTDGKITNEICKIIAERKPLRAVFRDNGFANDDVKTNVAQIFKQLSPNTDIKVL